MTLFSFNKFKNVIIPVMAKLNFQQPLPQPSLSHDPSEIILICSFGAQVFSEFPCVPFFFPQILLFNPCFQVILIN